LATTPLVLVILDETSLDVELDELECAAETLDETFDEELAAFDDELFATEEETWPRVAVIELLTLDDEPLLEVLEIFVEDDAEDLEEDFDEDFAAVEVVLTADDLVLDVLVAELKMHLHAFVTWDADRPGTGELVLVSAAHQLQKGVVCVMSSLTAATSWLTQTSFVLVVLLVVTALFETFTVLFLLVVDLDDVEISFAPLTTEWVDVLLAEDWLLTTHLQTFVRELAARSGSGEVLRLMMSQNSQNAAPYLTSPLKVLRSVAEQAGDISKLDMVV